MKRLRAFTLVELLVVIAIIALLISILAPSLGTVKRLAKATICMTNLNALNKAFVVYATVNKDKLMAYEWDANKAKCPANTWKSYMSFTVKDKNKDTDGYWKDRRLYGVLYASGDLKPWQLLYCPGQEYDDRVMASSYPEVYGTTYPTYVGAGPGADNFHGVGYMYDVHVTFKSSGWEYTYPRSLSKFPNDRWLTSDLIDFGKDNSDIPSHMAHESGKSNRWNIAYTDGHIVPNENAKAYAFMKNTPLSNYDIHEDWLNFITYGPYSLFVRNQ